MKQKYENIEDIPIEAIFEFTINPENTVCGFTAVVDGRVISLKKISIILSENWRNL